MWTSDRDLASSCKIVDMQIKVLDVWDYIIACDFRYRQKNCSLVPRTGRSGHQAIDSTPQSDQGVCTAMGVTYKPTCDHTMDECT